MLLTLRVVLPEPLVAELPELRVALFTLRDVLLAFEEAVPVETLRVELLALPALTVLREVLLVLLGRS